MSQDKTDNEQLPHATPDKGKLSNNSYLRGCKKLTSYDWLKDISEVAEYKTLIEVIDYILSNGQISNTP